MSSEQLCLKWNNFESNIASFLDILRNGNDFVDVTITCENVNFKAHKLILSACSPYFKGIFQVSGFFEDFIEVWSVWRRFSWVKFIWYGLAKAIAKSYSAESMKLGHVLVNKDFSKAPRTFTKLVGLPWYTC